MSIHGLGSPQEHGAASSAEPTKGPAKDQSAPGTVARGVGRGPSVAKLPPVRASRANDSALKQALTKMNAALRTTPKNPGSGFSLEATTDLYYAVAEVLVLKTNGNLTDKAIEEAADGLVEACLNDKNLRDKSLGDKSPADKNGALNKVYAENLRAASDYFREHTVLDSLRTDFGKDEPKEQARVANVVEWIKSHKNEVKGGYSIEKLGSRIFARLSEATRYLSADEVARVMAGLYDAHQKAVSDDIPIYEHSKESIDDLEKRLENATSPALGKARELIEIYRDAIFMEQNDL